MHDDSKSGNSRDCVHVIFFSSATAGVSCFRSRYQPIQLVDKLGQDPAEMTLVYGYQLAEAPAAGCPHRPFRTRVRAGRLNWRRRLLMLSGWRAGWSRHPRPGRRRESDIEACGPRVLRSSAARPWRHRKPRSASHRSLIFLAPVPKPHASHGEIAVRPILGGVQHV